MGPFVPKHPSRACHSGAATAERDHVSSQAERAEGEGSRSWRPPSSRPANFGATPDTHNANRSSDVTTDWTIPEYLLGASPPGVTKVVWSALGLPVSTAKTSAFLARSSASALSIVYAAPDPTHFISQRFTTLSARSRTRSIWAPGTLVDLLRQDCALTDTPHTPRARRICGTCQRHKSSNARPVHARTAPPPGPPRHRDLPSSHADLSPQYFSNQLETLGPVPRMYRQRRQVADFIAEGKAP